MSNDYAFRVGDRVRLASADVPIASECGQVFAVVGDNVDIIWDTGRVGSAVRQQLRPLVPSSSEMYENHRVLRLLLEERASLLAVCEAPVNLYPGVDRTIALDRMAILTLAIEAIRKPCT